MNNQIFLQLFKEHGPLMSGESLWKSMGFSTSAAFRQAKIQDRLSVKVFTLPKRRGLYAFTKDVADWLEQIEKEINV